MQIDKFKMLQREHLIMSMVLSVIMLFVYVGFILLIAFNKEWLAQLIGNSNLTIALPIGISVIIIAWILTGIYIIWANTRYDKQVEEIRKLGNTK